MTTWRTLISEAFDDYDDSWGNVVRCTISDELLDKDHDTPGFVPMDVDFMLWTRKFVYFPHNLFEGCESVRGMPRNPDGRPAPFERPPDAPRLFGTFDPFLPAKL